MVLDHLIHGGRDWVEVKQIAFGARNTTISLAKPRSPKPTTINATDLIKTYGGGGGGVGGLAELDVKSFAKSILLGLDCIHKKGYAHLDIKPKKYSASEGFDEEEEEGRLCL
ncbi:hypothetical protein Scep_011503 [Stephania cephalantha]|uniref:Protein kinase domain-containing protein n=1 Tax=Stephania cephalantha TaxID=152367 RepID=A0AAP0JE96_9MAGN